MRRYALAALAALFMVGATAAPTSAHSEPGFTGAEGICTTGGICGSGGGVLVRSGRYYMMTVAHVTGPLGADVWAYHPAFRYVGKLAYNRTN